jgi:glycosyltransferase involved in cell wall biosynthesis
MSVKPNVLILVGSFDVGGAESQAIQLARLMKEDGRYRVHLGCMRRSGVLLEAAEALDIGEIAEFPITSLANHTMAMQLIRFRTFVKEHRIAIVHSQDLYMNVLGMFGAALAAVPARIAFWGWIGESFPFSRMLLQKGAFRLSHVIHANSEKVKDHLLKIGVSENKIVRIYNGLDLMRVTPGRGFRREDFLESLGLAPDTRSLVTIVANMRLRVKDHQMFLRAAQLVRQAVPEAKFILAGEGELVQSLRSFASELGLQDHALFIGRCDSVAELLAVSDIAVLSSKSEGFSNSILEYMGAGLPVVATDVGGVREAVMEGESGYIVSPGDYESLADRIIALLRRPEEARAMGVRGRKIVEHKFSDHVQLENTRELYDKLLERADIK